MKGFSSLWILCESRGSYKPFGMKVELLGFLTHFRFFRGGSMDAFWTGKSVFITGASGFLGYWLTKALITRGAHVTALVRDHDPQSAFFYSDLYKKTRIVQGALEEYATLERVINEHEVDTVFHLGAQTIVGTALRNPLATFESNIRGSYNLFEACRRHHSLIQRIVVASSDKAYGSSEFLPYTEKMPLQGKHPYDVSKSCTDLLATTYYHTYRLPIAIARCGNLYGGNDLNWSRLIPGAIQSFYYKQPPVIRSDGTHTRDYLYVEDATLAYMMLATKLHQENVCGEAFNFGPNTPLTVLQVIQSVQGLMNCQAICPKIMAKAKEEIQDQCLDSNKAAEILGWEPQFSLEEGLSLTIPWYTQYFERKHREQPCLA